MAKFYLAGSGGMLGEAFYSQLNGSHDLKCTDIDLNSDWLDYCDFREFDEYRASVIDFSPDYLLHLGAHTDLEYCELNADDTYLTNTLAVEHAASIANELDIPLVYISTAGIFDGKKILYDDWDVPNPLGLYARSKFLGEQIVQSRVEKHLICRAGWMMGGGPKKDKKFINKLLKQLLSGVTDLKIVDDRLGTPTYTQDFVKNLLYILMKKKYGLYNLVCRGDTGRLEVAQTLVRILKLNELVTVTSVPSSYFGVEYFAPRPPSERLINYKLNLLGMDQMRDWQVALQDYLETYFAEELIGLVPQ